MATCRTLEEMSLPEDRPTRVWAAPRVLRSITVGVR
jgi:hypothetical protein